MTLQEKAAQRDAARDYWCLMATQAESTGSRTERLGTVMARLRVANGEAVVNHSTRPRVPAQRGE